MDELAEALDEVVVQLRDRVIGPAVDGRMRLATEAAIVDVLARAAEAQRLLDAVVVEAVAEVEHRTEHCPGEGRMTHRYGCGSVVELVERVTRVSAATARRWHAAAGAVGLRTAATTGERLDPDFPALRAAMLDGEIGAEGVAAATRHLREAGTRVEVDGRLAADEALAGAARGDDAPALGADALGLQGRVWAAALDQDGARPRERRMQWRRGVTLGAPTESGVPLRGTLMPEVAAQLQQIFDAVASPRQSTVRFVDPSSPDDDPAPVDDRSPAQRRHDAFATALTVAASSKLLPTVGGAAPTLVVSVTDEALVTGSGEAFAEGCDAAVSLGSARHVACSGVIQRVTLGPEGRILRLGTEERVFNRHQRRAIALRDGGCVIPGCRIPAGWCEIHHVTQHARGGPTHTDNGVLLCWFHHRFLDQHGWLIRMHRGVPEVRAPGWYDATMRWRAVTTSRVRLTDQVLRR